MTEGLGLLAEAPPPAHAIDRAVPRRGRDPRPGIGRDAPDGPRLECGDERVLDRLLGEVEVAEDADERRDRPALLFAEQAVDDLVRGGVGLAQSAAVAWRRAPSDMYGTSQIGRISIEPCVAPGISAA